MRIVEYVNVTFTYIFTITKPAEITVTYSLNITLTSPAGWSKTFVNEEGGRLTFKGSTARLTLNIPINTSLYEGVVRSINRETGINVMDYTLILKPEIHTVAYAEGHRVDSIFEPKLEFKAQYSTSKGDIYTLDGLEHRDEKTLTHTEKITHPEVSTRRYVSYIIAAPAYLGLAYAVYNFLKTRPPEKKPIESKFEPYKELIAVAAQEPIYEAGKTTVRVKTLEDLGKIADTLMKPIIHGEEVLEKDGVKVKRHIFYVLDENVRYEYVIEEAEAKPEVAKPVEEAKKTVRLECPYLDKKGRKCGKIAFGRSMEEAYSRLERHVAKDHPDRLEEFKKTYGGR
jgi:hypothetical protein